MSNNILQLKERLCDDTLEDDLLFLSRAIERSNRPCALIGYIETTLELYNSINDEICSTFKIPSKRQFNVDYTNNGTHLPSIIEEYKTKTPLNNQSITLIRIQGIEYARGHFHHRDQDVCTLTYQGKWLPGITLLSYCANCQFEKSIHQRVGDEIIGSQFKNFHWVF